jgi:hypothetical protein
MRLSPKNPKTIIEHKIFVVLRMIVNQILSVLLLNTSRKAKIERQIEKITSVQNPVNEMSVSKTVAK